MKNEATSLIAPKTKHEEIGTQGDGLRKIKRPGKRTTWIYIKDGELWVVADCIPRSALLGSGSTLLSVRLTRKKTVVFIPAGRCLSFLSHPFLRARGSRTLPFLMRAASKPFSDWEDPEIDCLCKHLQVIARVSFYPRAWQCRHGGTFRSAVSWTAVRWWRIRRLAKRTGGRR